MSAIERVFTQIATDIAVDDCRMDSAVEVCVSPPSPACAVKSPPSPARGTKRSATAMDSSKPYGMDINDLPPNHYYLGNSVFVVVVFFNGDVKVHVRNFYLKDGLYYPAKEGVCLSVKTWVILQKKLRFPKFDKTCVLNSELLLVNSDSSIQLQQMYKLGEIFQLRTSAVILNYQQFDALNGKSGDITKSACSLVLETAVPAHIYSEIATLTNIEEVDDTSTASAILRNGLINILKNSINENISTVFVCNGCSRGAYGHLNHKCMTTSRQAKFCKYHEKAIACLNFKNIAVKFCSDFKNYLSAVNTNFFNFIDYDKFIDEMESASTALDIGFPVLLDF